jgi:predicted RNase H-like HicB family nuclease
VDYVAPSVIALETYVKKAMLPESSFRMASGGRLRVQSPNEEVPAMTAREFTYTVAYEHDSETGRICASIPALDLATHGQNLEEARAMIREALELHLEGTLEEQMPIPPDVIHVEQVTVAVSTPAPDEARA